MDDRQPAEPVREPSAAEIVERATRLRERTAAMLTPRASEPVPTSRYTALLALLPTYAPDPSLTAESGDDLHAGSAPSGSSAQGYGSAGVLTQPRHLGAHERPTPQLAEVGPRRRAPMGPAAGPQDRGRPQVRALTPAIRERVADLAGLVVGTIMVDLETDEGSSAAPATDASGRSDGSADLTSDAEGTSTGQTAVAQLPLSRWPNDHDGRN